MLIYILNGPNLNLLGTREPEIYGHDTLDDIAVKLDEYARANGAEVEIRQSNHEGHLIDWIHEASIENANAIILNAGAYTHSSIALYDAIKSIDTPVIEVHLSNPYARESFRRQNKINRAVKGTISGFGAFSYQLALHAVLQQNK